MGFLQAAVLAVSLLVVVDANLRDVEMPFVGSDPANPSSMGTRFLVAFPQNVPAVGAITAASSYIEVSTVEDGTVEFDVITNLGGNQVTTSYEVNCTNPRRIPFTSFDIYVTSITQRDKAISVETKNGKKVSVYVINDETSSTDGYVALPCDGMAVPGDYRRYNYVILSAQQQITPDGSASLFSTQFLILTCEDDTVVTVRPTLRLSEVETFGVGNFGGDETIQEAQWQISGNQMIPSKQTLLISQLGSDFSGSLVYSTKPIVVIAGHQCGQVPSGVTACDYQASQVPPDTTWGYTFLLSPLSGTVSGDLYRFATVYDNTQVNITCVDEGSSTSALMYTRVLSGTPGSRGSNWDQYQTYSVVPATAEQYVPRYCCLESSNPVIVAQYSYGYTRASAPNMGNIGDPFMTIIPPIVQYLKSYTIVPVMFTAGPVLRRRVSVCVSLRYFVPDRILLDNNQLQPASQWNAVYCNGGVICGYCTARQVDDLYHKISINESGGAIFVHMYGFGVENSYAVAGGMELERISGIAVRCTVPDGCVEEGSSVVVTCSRSGDLTEQTRITVNTEDGTAIAPSDYMTLDLPEARPNIRAGNLLNFRGGTNRDPSIPFSVQVNNDEIEEGEEDFFIIVANVRSANVLTPRVKIAICGRNCPILIDPTDGTVVVTGTTPGSTATYMCNDGFDLIGAQVLNCGNNGRWDSTPPVCQRRQVFVSFNPTSYTVTEGVDENAVLSLVRSGDLSREVVVNISTSDGSAMSGSDYGSVTPSTVTFLSGVTSASVSILILNDPVIESAESFTALLTSFKENLVIVNKTATVTILDDDMCPPLMDIPNGGVMVSNQSTGIATYTCDEGYTLVGEPTRICMSNSMWSGSEPNCTLAQVTVSFDPTSYTVTEGVDDNAVLSLVRSGDLSREVVVSVSTSDNSAMSGSDYSFVAPSTVTFLSGVTAASVSVPILDDTMIESIESFTASLTSSQTNVVTVNDTATVTILDIDLCPPLPNITNGDVMVSNRSTGGIAEYICDEGYTLVGEPTRICMSNSMWSGSEPNCTLAQVVVSFNPTSYTVTEGEDNSVNLMLVRSGDLTRSTIVTVTTIDGSATGGSDYDPTTRDVTFAPNVGIAQLPVPIIDDNLMEGTEMFTATLFTTETNVMIGEDTATVSILDNDVPRPVFDQTMYTVPENNRTVPLCIDVGVELPGPMEYTITAKTKDPVDATMADFSHNTTITVTPPSTMACIDFTNLVVDDDIALEGDQSFTICVGNSTSMVVIIDDDEPRLESDNVSIIEDGGSTTVTVRLLNDIENEYPVVYTVNDGTALGGIDYIDDTGSGSGSGSGSGLGSGHLDLVGTLTFVPGGLKELETHNINIIDDVIVEPDETIIIEFLGGVFQSIVTIIDNDAPMPEFQQTMYTVPENNRTVPLCVDVGVTVSDDVQYIITAKNKNPPEAQEADFYPNDTITIPAGSNSACHDFTCLVVDDTIALEGNQSFTICVGNSTSMVVIIDDDVPMIESSNVVINEDGGSAVLTVKLFNEIEKDFMLAYSTREVPGGAEADEDFGDSGGSITFIPGGDKEEEISIPINDDTLTENDEPLTVRFSSDDLEPGQQTQLSNSTITIIDNDIVVGFNPIMYEISEGEGPVTLMIFRMGNEQLPANVTFVTVSGTADASDYTETVTVVMFAPGELSMTVEVPITDDNLVEDPEIFTATLMSDAPNVIVDSNSSNAVITIISPEVPAPAFAETMYTVPEDDPGSVPLCVDIGVMITEPITYMITTGPKSPPEAEDEDYTSGTSITIQPPGPQACINFSDIIVNDNIGLEGDESFTIFINGTDSMSMVTITEDDPVSVGFNPIAYTVAEGNTAQLMLVKQGETEGPISVTVTSTDNTAIAGQDYSPLVDGQRVTFNPGESTKTVAVDTLTDSVAEDTESFFGNIATSTPGVNIVNPQATVVISEEVIPEIFFSTKNVMVGESDGTAEVCLNLSVPLSTNLRVAVSTTPGSANNGLDYLGATETATFTAGSTQACVTFVILDDDIALEGDETFDATFRTPSGFITREPSTSTVTIVDDDVFTIQFTEEDYSYIEGDPNAQVCLEGNGQIAQAATATISSLPQGTATVGEDYTAVSSEDVQFVPDGDRIICVPVALLNDSVLEREESFPVIIEAVSPTPGVVTGNQDSTTVRIIDDDMVSIGFDPVSYAVDEGDGTAVLTVKVLSGELSEPVVVDFSTTEGSATDPEDYTSTQLKLTFTSTDTKASVSVPLVNDELFETVEEFGAQLVLSVDDTEASPGGSVSPSNVEITQPTATVTISDDDAPNPVFELTMYTVPENDTSGVPLCVDIGVTITEPITYTITTAQKSPLQAEDSDFGTSAEVTIPVPGPSACIDFTDLVVDDNVALEGDEAFTIIVGSSMAMVTIVDEDVPRTTSPNVGVPEDVGEAEVCVFLETPLEENVTLGYITVDATASASEDYVFTVGFNDFSTEESTKCIFVPIIDDNVTEPTEQFTVFFTINGRETSNATVSIFDNEPRGTTVNDTIIGDPLFTVTLPSENEFMCYEVHGQDGKFFNLISDQCLSVNALFTILPSNLRLNRMSEIGIVAINTARQCVEIKIDVEDCSATLMGRGSITSMYQDRGISIRQSFRRWRVSVPNCGLRQTVPLWIICDSMNMLRFHIARGNNLMPTSHGLLAQFWNIPITPVVSGNDTYLRVFDEGDPSYRLIPADREPRTWDHTKAPCYYVGNSQGGPLTSHNPKESVIEGSLSQYETSDLFSATFYYTRFDAQQCSITSSGDLGSGDLGPIAT